MTWAHRFEVVGQGLTSRKVGVWKKERERERMSGEKE